MSHPVLSPDEVRPETIDRAFVESGGFLLLDPGAAVIARDVVAAARRFFDLPLESKSALAIERSPHFRGWSEMKNERDWREQIHFGRERAGHAAVREFLRLEGPNLWPSDPAFRAAVTRYLAVVAAAGARVLGVIARGLGVGLGLGGEAGAFGDTAGDGYQLLKLICYWAQQHEPRGQERAGVAAHVDFSYLTLTLQDGAGLSVRRADGVWTDVEPLAGAWWVHPGELLEFATRGRYPATPHRVTNHSRDRTRLSLPFFLNPALDAVVRELDTVSAREQRSRPGEHVHHVLSSSTTRDAEPFVFGEAEWRRKGLNHWCVDCQPG